MHDDRWLFPLTSKISLGMGTILFSFIGQHFFVLSGRQELALENLASAVGGSEKKPSVGSDREMQMAPLGFGYHRVWASDERPY